MFAFSPATTLKESQRGLHFDLNMSLKVTVMLKSNEFVSGLPKRWRRMQWLPALLLSFFALFFGLGGGTAFGLTKVVITFASFSEREGVLFVAKDQNFFRKYDLDAEIIYVATGSVAMSALSRGSSQSKMLSMTESSESWKKRGCFSSILLTFNEVSL